MNKGKVLLTGSQGFIGSAICADLLANDYKVVGVDNYSKYGKVERPHDNHPNFTLIKADIRDFEVMWNDPHDTNGFGVAVKDVDFIIAAGARIGGISFFTRYAFDLLAENEEILASTFRLAVDLFKTQQLKRILVLSSSMVYESATKFPTPEGEQLICPPPLSTYGFQKLASEYFCKGAYEQYKLPYSIIRPFNCCGLFEDEALGSETAQTGNVKMLLSHVLPDLIHRSLHLKPTDCLSVFGQGNQIRCYTHQRDIARGIRMIMESDKAINNDFNISHPKPTTVKELAELVWKKIHGTELKLEFLKPFEYDVQKRIPDVNKAKEILGFEAEIGLEQTVDEVIAWMKNKQIKE